MLFSYGVFKVLTMTLVECTTWFAHMKTYHHRLSTSSTSACLISACFAGWCLYCIHRQCTSHAAHHPDRRHCICTAWQATVNARQWWSHEAVRWQHHNTARPHQVPTSSVSSAVDRQMRGTARNVECKTLVEVSGTSCTLFSAAGWHNTAGCYSVVHSAAAIPRPSTS